MKKNMFTIIKVLAIVFLVNTMMAQGKIPETNAGNMFKGWLESVNTGDKEVITKFIKENFGAKFFEKSTAEELASQDMEIHSQTGKLSVYSAESPTENSVKAVVHSADKTMWAEITFKVTAENPAKIVGIGLKPVQAPQTEKPARMPDADLVKDLDNQLQKVTAEDSFSGTVLIAKNGNVIYNKAFGMADRDKKIPNNTDTKFAVGSMSKMMTSVAIAKLVQEGKLSFDDKLSKCLPGYPNKEVAEKVTVHHLLTHTSGLPDVFTPEWDAKKDQVKNVNDWLEFFVNKPLQFEPGKDWAYSNAGFVVLGAIIEKVSGKDYYTYIRENIAKPLGMNNSEFYSKDDKVENMAMGYTTGQKPGGPKTDNVDTRPYRGFPAGGGYSTTGDMLKFANGLKNNKLLNKEITENIISVKFPMSPDQKSGYAYGFGDNTNEGIRVVGHNGGAPGMNGELKMYWNSGYVVIVLSNLDPPAASKMFKYINDRIDAK